MPKRLLTAIALLAAAPAVAQQAGPPTPSGSYLVYAEDTGTAFVTVDPEEGAAGRWPLAFFYFGGGAIAGSATMVGEADCDAGIVSARLLGATGPDGAALPVEDAPEFTFSRVESSGDQAVVTFVCNDAGGRLYLAEQPISGTPEAVARRYLALRGAGIADRPARRLAIRAPDAAAALVDEIVPAESREAARAALAEE